MRPEISPCTIHDDDDGVSFTKPIRSNVSYHGSDSVLGDAGISLPVVITPTKKNNNTVVTLNMTCHQSDIIQRVPTMSGHDDKYEYWTPKTTATATGNQLDILMEPSHLQFTTPNKEPKEPNIVVSFDDSHIAKAKATCEGVDVVVDVKEAVQEVVQEEMKEDMSTTKNRSGMQSPEKNSVTFRDDDRLCEVFEIDSYAKLHVSKQDLWYTDDFLRKTRHRNLQRLNPSHPHRHRRSIIQYHRAVLQCKKDMNKHHNNTIDSLLISEQLYHKLWNGIDMGYHGINADCCMKHVIPYVQKIVTTYQSCQTLQFNSEYQNKLL
jgi:hypothetical protein